MLDFFRELFLESPVLLTPHPLTGAVGLVDVAELVDEVVIVLDPLQTLSPHGNLATTAGHDTPAETLLRGDTGQPIEVPDELSNALLDDVCDGGIGERLLPPEDFELWDHLLLEHIQDQTLELVSLCCDGVLSDTYNDIHLD